MTNNKWMMNRAGLLNFWYYDDEVFDFSNGKMLLRGSNGSGKSVTMQSFLPVLLDGKKSPDRLDPFGSKARRMEDYLLGEKGVVDRDERTGYLFIEYKREHTEQYITTGIGLQAKRDKTMKFWGFIILDNRRIGQHIDLYKLEMNAGEQQKIPLSRKELENRIGQGGHVVTTQGDYMKLVNKHVFGFPSIDAFNDLIKLLIQLRSPKLSKDFKPTVIYDILESSLPPLSDEDLRHLSDTIEQMDQAKQQLEQLEREFIALKRVTSAYDQYNKYLLAEKEAECSKAQKKAELHKQSLQQAINQKEQLQVDIESLGIAIRSLKQQQMVNQQEERRLQSHEVFNLEEERRTVRDREADLTQKQNDKESQLDHQRAQERELKKSLESRELEQSGIQSAMDDLLDDLSADAEEAAFNSHPMNAGDFTRHLNDDFDFTFWHNEADSHYHTLVKVTEIFRDYEQLKTRYAELDHDYSQLTLTIDLLRQQQQDYRKLFDEDKEKHWNAIHLWLKEQPYLSVSEDVMQRTSRFMYALYEPHSYDSIVEPFREASQLYQQHIHKEIAGHLSEKSRIEAAIQETETELQEWENKKDPEPVRHPETEKARTLLKEKGEAFLPFYAAVEFREGVSPEMRERIESGLSELGMLDALITADPLDLTYDRLLMPGPEVEGESLRSFLKPDIEKGYQSLHPVVETVLKSIAINDDETSLFDETLLKSDGRFSIGPIRGHARPAGDARFIGRTARKTYRKNQIAYLKTVLEQLIDEQANVNQKMTELQATIQTAKAAISAFPKETDLRDGYDEIYKLTKEIEQTEANRKKLDERLKNTYNRLTTVKQSLDQETRPFSLEKTQPAYYEAVSVMRRYEKTLAELKTEHIKFRSAARAIEQLAVMINDKVQTVDTLKGELNEIEDHLQRTALELEKLDQKMKELGAEDVLVQIQQVKEALRSIQRELDSHQNVLPRKETELSQVDKTLEGIKTDAAFWEQLAEAWVAAVQKEAGYRFILDSEQDSFEELTRTVKELCSPLLQQTDRQKVAEQLTKAYYKEQSDLLEYRMTEYQLAIERPGWMSGNWTDEQLLHLTNWKEKTTRKFIDLDFHGQRVSPYFVKNALENDLIQQHATLEDQDKRLFEDILLNTVGNILRSRIQRAEQWTLAMNSLMADRNSSSGLTFSIKWKPRTAESENELDTKDLVELLRKDPRLLREEDMGRVTEHFRSRIDRAKEMISWQSDGNTLHQVLKDVLDYRQWFSFVLSFQRENEPKRELTNHAFYQFSGGEKAMAMYIPLFTAAYSRYQEADSSAPYIITLDEAFAGVDENNIRDMFAVVEELGFNYIMNSQALWGDYESVSDLAICELVRPKNASFVSVIRYLWDGTSRHLVTDQGHKPQLTTQGE